MKCAVLLSDQVILKRKEKKTIMTEKILTLPFRFEIENAVSAAVTVRETETVR